MVVIKFKDNQECFYDGYLKQLLDAFKEAVQKHNTSSVFIIDGKSGKGKTTLGIQCGKYLNENDITLYYEPETFLKGLAEAKPESYHQFDEAMIISNRSSLTEINRMIIQAMSMIRSKRLYVIFCVNSIFDLDRNLVLSRAEALLHVYSDGLLDRGKFTAFFKASGDKIDRLKLLYLNGKKLYSYSKPRANFYGSFSKKFLINEEEYEKEKQICIDDFLRGKSRQKVTKIRKTANKAIYHLYNNIGLKMKEIAEIVQMDAHTVSGWIKEIEEEKELNTNPSS